MDVRQLIETNMGLKHLLIHLLKRHQLVIFNFLKNMPAVGELYETLDSHAHDSK